MNLKYIALFVKCNTNIFREEHFTWRTIYSVDYKENWFFVWQNHQGFWETELLSDEYSQENFLSMNNAIYFTIKKCNLK